MNTNSHESLLSWTDARQRFGLRERAVAIALRRVGDLLALGFIWMERWRPRHLRSTVFIVRATQGCRSSNSVGLKDRHEEALPEGSDVGTKCTALGDGA
ncbi:hypothetical protein JXA47_15250, partial [Candidatus Sumerlaeota bacterium]|nr:hypothetical protein [Candidatus Sumerlaeota bacterium]